MKSLLLLSLTWTSIGIAQIQVPPADLQGQYTVYINGINPLNGTTTFKMHQAHEAISLNSNKEASLILFRSISDLDRNSLEKIVHENLYGYHKVLDRLVRTCLGKYEVDSDKNVLIIEFQDCLHTPDLHNKDVQSLPAESALGHFNRRYVVFLGFKHSNPTGFLFQTSEFSGILSKDN